MTLQTHATAIEWENVGILIRGAPGSGKTELALKLIGAGATLIADDQVILNNEENKMMASCPPQLTGLMEIKAIGIVEMNHKVETTVGLVIDLVDNEEAVPEPEVAEILGIHLPLLRLNPFYLASTQKVRLAVNLIRGKTSGRETFLGGKS